MIDFDGAVAVALPVASGFGEDADRECLLLEGPQGWGEFSPPRNASAERAARWLTTAVEPGTVGWPDPVRGRVPVSVRVPSVDPETAARLVVESGCRTADVVVGRAPLADDAARVRAVRDALGAAGALRLEAGATWDAATAEDALAALVDAADGVQFVVESCTDRADSVRVGRSLDVPVAMVARFDDTAAALTEADVVVLTPGALGGVRRALRIAEVLGLPCVAASGLETSIGMAAAAALAGALPELPYASPIGLPPWVTADVVAAGRTLVPRDGHLPVAPMPAGPDPQRLAELAITDPDRLARWRDRLTSARAAL